MSSLDASQRGLELVVGERLDTSALVAHEVVMVIVRDVDALVVRTTVAEVELLHELLLGEDVEHAVDARDADLAAVGASSAAISGTVRQQSPRASTETTACRAAPVR